MRFVALLLSLFAPSIACAAGLAVQVRTPAGAPVIGAVVTVHLVGRATPQPGVGPALTVSQQNLQFHPFTLVVPVGTSVTFPNLDSVRHHVYSFAPAKRFELKLYAREQTRSVTFDKPGIVPLGCNIHDQMSAFIDVVDTPWATTTDAAGNATIADLPAGALSVTVWHPYLRAPGNQLSRQTTTGAHEAFAVTLRSPARAVGASPY